MSIKWFAYIGSYFLASIFYGISIKSGAVTASSVITGVIQIPIVIGLWKFKEREGALSLNDKIQVVLFSLMVPAMAFLPWKEMLYLVFSIGTIYSLATQPWELWKEGKTGVVEIRMVLIFLVSTVFWTMFAFATKAVALMVVAPTAFVLLGITWILWVHFRRVEKTHF